MSSLTTAFAFGGDGSVSTTPIATLNSLSTPTYCALPYASAWHSTLTSTAGGALVQFNAGLGSPSVKFVNVNNTNFSNAGAVAVDVSNPTSSEADILLILHDSAGNVLQNIFAIPADSTKSVALMLAPAASTAQFGILALPSPYSGFSCLPGFTGESVSLSAIKDVMIGPAGNSPASSLVLSNIRLLPTFDWTTLMTGCIDAYGQSTLTSWSGKLTDPAQFATRRAAEEASFGNLLGNSVDAYGGSMVLPAQNATGHFRTQFINGKWWIITPLGHLFFMNGVDEMRSTSPRTIVTNRLSMFDGLPLNGDPLAVNYASEGGGLTSYNFYTANLQRKYGANWESNWVNTAMSRLSSWGLNSLGSFAGSDMIAAHQKPYLFKTDITGTFNTVSTGSDLWGPTPDPFDPRFVATAKVQANSFAGQALTDPYLIGFVVGNELSWTGNTGTAPDTYALGLGTLAQNTASSPAKAAFLATLTREYVRIQKLNRAWNTKFTSFAAMNAPLAFNAKIPALMQRDLTQWVGTYAAQYYKVVRTAFKSACPNTLYFGTSYSTSHTTPQVISAAAANADVLAFNIYGTSLPASVQQTVSSVSIPIVATEFNFSSTSDGLWGAFVQTPDQNSRAQAYSDFMTMLLTNPKFVGANFYMYVDQPTAGSVPNGQNNTQGLVDITDTPYPVLINMIKTVSANKYTTRWGS